MNRNRKFVLTALLSLCALSFGVLAAYFFSILWRGEWKYPELILPTSGAFLAEVLVLFGVALIYRRERGIAGIAAVARFTALMTAGCCAVAVGLFFALLSNCSLSCENQVVAQSQSPNGHWKAVLFSRNCVAAARHCPSFSYVSVLPAGATLPGGEGNVFSIATDIGIDLKWRSDDLLLVRYPPARILRRRERFGNVRIQYMPVGSM